MSIAVMANLGAYALVVTDVRSVFTKPDSEEILFHIDRSFKLANIGIGLATGLGYVPLLDAVKRDLASQTVTEVGQVLQTIEAHRQRFLEQPRFNQYIREAVAQKTSFFFTYRKPPEEGDPAVLRLAGTYPMWGGLRSLTSYVAVPHGTTDGRAADACEYFQDQVRPIADISDRSAFDDNFAYHIRLAAGIVSGFAAVNPHVSPEFQVGVHGPFGVKISEVCRDGKTVAFREPGQTATAMKGTVL